VHTAATITAGGDQDRRHRPIAAWLSSDSAIACGAPAVLDRDDADGTGVRKHRDARKMPGMLDMKTESGLIPGTAQ
jgi:hypothetical protein